MRLPGVCIVCRDPVEWVDGRWRDQLVRGLAMPHVCGMGPAPVYPKGVCGAWMPNARERCARKPGHGYEHRTAYALANARAMATGRAA